MKKNGNAISVQLGAVPRDPNLGSIGILFRQKKKQVPKSWPAAKTSTSTKLSCNSAVAQSNIRPAHYHQHPAEIDRDWTSLRMAASIFDGGSTHTHTHTPDLLPDLGFHPDRSGWRHSPWPRNAFQTASAVVQAITHRFTRFFVLFCVCLGLRIRSYSPSFYFFPLFFKFHFGNSSFRFERSWPNSRND